MLYFTDSLQVDSPIVAHMMLNFTSLLKLLA